MAKPAKLQRAGRDFLIRLVARHGLAGAARVLRALADEFEELWGLTEHPAKDFEPGRDSAPGEAH
jgi:hypothetical protein